MLIQGRLERTETNLIHFKWGSVRIVTSKTKEEVRIEAKNVERKTLLSKPNNRGRTRIHILVFRPPSSFESSSLFFIPAKLTFTRRCIDRLASPRTRPEPTPTSSCLSSSFQIYPNIKRCSGMQSYLRRCLNRRRQAGLNLRQRTNSTCIHLEITIQLSARGSPP